MINADVPLLGAGLGYRGAIHEDIFAHRAGSGHSAEMFSVTCWRG
jgi:hypothetical protein